jgi:hypothetical protein
MNNPMERSGRPMAVPVSFDDYQRWQRLAKDQVFAMIEAVQKRNAKAPSGELERDIRDALKSLRQQARVHPKSKA